MNDLCDLLAVYVHAHQTGNSVPPHIDAEARAVLARWGSQQPLRPIPVSERLPGPEGCGVGDWLPIDTAPRDGTKILASDYDCIDIVAWYKGRPGEWLNREGEAIYPVWWQPLPEHPPLPEAP